MKSYGREQDVVVHLVDEHLHAAVSQRASDIHFEPAEKGLRIRYRIDGVLHDRQQISTSIMGQVLARLKILAHLDITERRIPHDGKFSFMYEQHPIDVRVSTFPALSAEHIVVRLLDRARVGITLDQLGMNDTLAQACKKLLHKSAGFFVVTGPTGSGKTTTLYAALAALNTPDKHIITLEDPIEYHIEGITQGQVHPEAGFTFEKGIRAILRQDPDIIMIGEIRDVQTARIALQAAMTGHLVLSTAHTVDAPGFVSRLIDMGVEPFLITEALSGILAQRLVRIICTSCRYERMPTAHETAFLGQHMLSDTKLFEGRGCASCHGLGYKGRQGIFELLTMNDQMRLLLTAPFSMDALRSCALQHGMRALVADGLDKVHAGSISLQECIKAVI